MRLTRHFAVAALALVALVASTQLASAQNTIAPNHQFGIGINTGAFQLQYALTPGMHLGADIALQSGEGTTDFAFGPYFRALFEGTVNPFVQAGFVLEQVSQSGVSQSRSLLYAAFGLEYFINRNVGVWASASVLNLYLDPSATYFGFFSPRAGVEWFFNP